MPFITTPVASLYNLLLKEIDKEGSWGSWIFYGLQGADRKGLKKLSPDVGINQGSVSGLKSVCAAVVERTDEG